MAPRTSKKRQTRRRRKQQGGSLGNVAFLFSGRINAYEYVKEHLLEVQRKYNAKFFCSINKETINEYVKDFFKIFQMGPDQYKYEGTPLPDWLYSCKLHDHYTSFERTYSVLYHNKSVFNLLEEYQKKHNVKFDIIVLYRADIEPLDGSKLILQKPEPNTLYAPEGNEYKGFGGRIEYGTFDTMKTFCSAVDSLKGYCENKVTELNHEMVLGAHVRAKGITYKRFSFNFNLHPSRKDKRKEYVEGEPLKFQELPPL